MPSPRPQPTPNARYIQGRHEQIEYWAFAPNPLPPELAFSSALVTALSAADRRLGELSGVGRNLPNPHLLIQPFIYREAVLSSRIEGTEATMTDVYAYNAGQLPLPGVADETARSDVHEVANYVRALEFGLEHLGTYPLSLWFVRGLHRILLQGVRGERDKPGEFRTIQNYIGPPRSTIKQATYIPALVAELQPALEALEGYLSLDADNRYPPLIRLAFIHYQFEAIHPFLDGNGRVGRLLISVLLQHWGLLSHPLLYLSAYFEEHRDDYLDLLQGVTSFGNWYEWTLFFLQGINEQADDAMERTKRLQDLRARWRAELMRTGTSARLLGMVDGLFETPIISIPRAQEMLDVTYRAAARNIQKLVELGMLRPFGESSYRRLFVADEILRTVEEGVVVG